MFFLILVIITHVIFAFLVYFPRHVPLEEGPAIQVIYQNNVIARFVVLKCVRLKVDSVLFFNQLTTTENVVRSVMIGLCKW